MTPLEAAAALEAQAEEIEAQNAKLVALGLASSCACSVDAPDAVCMHHSPRLTAALDRLSALEQAAAPFVLAASMARVLMDDFDSAPDDEPLSITPVTVGAVRALAHAAGGGE